MTRTAFIGRLFTALSLMIVFGCEPGLDKGHPVPQTERAIDDVKFWTTVEDEKAHRAAMQQLSMVPQKLRDLKSSAVSRKKDEVNKWKALEDKGESVTEQKAIADKAWTDFETLYAQYEDESATAAMDKLIESYDSSPAKDLIVEGLIAFSSMARDANATEIEDAKNEKDEDGQSREPSKELIAKNEKIISKISPVLVKAITNTDEPDLAWEAAEELLRGDIDPAWTKQLIDVLADLKAPVRNRWAASRLMAEAPVTQAIPTLISILDGDPDIYPIVLVSDSAAALGKMAATEAIPGLVRCLWLNDDRGRNANQACRVALNRIAKAPGGSAAVLKELNLTLERKNKRVEDRAKIKRYDESGIVEAQIANLLGDKPIATEKSVPALVKTATTVLVPPAYIKGHPTYEVEFQKGNVQKTISSSMAIAYIGTPDADLAVDYLVKMANDKDPYATEEDEEKKKKEAAKPAKDKAEGEEEKPVRLAYPLEFRLTAIEQLAYLGSAKAIPGLLDIVRTDEGEPNVPEMGDLHALQFQAMRSAVFLVNPDNPESLKAVEEELAKLKALYEGWLKTMDDELKAAPQGAKETLALKQDAGRTNVTNQLKFLKDETEKYLGQVKDCKSDPDCWAKVLPTDDRARHYMRNHRIQRAVLVAAKQCKAEADKSACLAKGIPDKSKSTELAKAYSDIASTFKKANDPQIPGKVREDKTLSQSEFLVDTALFCKGDIKCWSDLLPNAKEMGNIITSLPAVQERISNVAVANNLSFFHYNASTLVEKTVGCRETFAACEMKYNCDPNGDKEKYKTCSKERREKCVESSRCLSNFLSQRTETEKYENMYKRAEFGVAGDPKQGPVQPSPTAIAKQIAREHDEEEANFLVETATACAIGSVTQPPEGMSRSERRKFKGEPILTTEQEDACWKGKFSSRARANTFAKIFESMEKTISGTMASPRSDGKPRDEKKVITATKKRFSERFADAEKYYAMGAACSKMREDVTKPKKGEDSAWITCWRQQLSFPANHTHLRDLYKKAYAKAKRRTVIDTIAIGLGWDRALGIESSPNIAKCAEKKKVALCVFKARPTLFRDNRRFAEDIVKTAERCKDDKDPAKCWGTGIAGTSRAGKLMKAYDKGVRTTENRAVGVALTELKFDTTQQQAFKQTFSLEDATFVVEKGTHCKDDLECWNARVARRRHKVRVLAAYRLGHQMHGPVSTKAKAIDTLASYMDDPDHDFRVVVLQSINRIADIGNEVVVKALTDSIDKDTKLKKSGKKGAGRMISAMKLALAQFEKPGSSN